MVNIDKPWQRVRARATVKLWADHPLTSKLVADMTAMLKREPTYKEVHKAADGKANSVVKVSLYPLNIIIMGAGRIDPDIKPLLVNCGCRGKQCKGQARIVV